MTNDRTAYDTLALDHVTRALADHAPNTAPSEQAARNAAVAMILRESAGVGLETFFIKRAERAGDPWSGHMAFPGGRRDPKDATLEAAARRETLEEVSISLDEARLLGRLHDIDGGRLTAHQLAVTPFVYHHPAPPDAHLNYEVADTVWIPLSFMAEPANVRTYFFPLDPFHREFPSFQYKGYTVWGLTYRIVANFMALFDIHLPGEPKVTDVE